MSEATATVKAGICGFTTLVRVAADDSYQVRYEATTDCPRITSLVAAIQEAGDLNALAELGRRNDATVLAAARDTRHGVCVGCVVPNGLYKTMQVAAGLALPADSQIALAVEEES